MSIVAHGPLVKDFYSIFLELFQAKHHFLVMPRVSIPSLKSLTPDNLELLKHCEKKGKEIADK